MSPYEVKVDTEYRRPSQYHNHQNGHSHYCNQVNLISDYQVKLLISGLLMAMLVSLSVEYSIKSLRTSSSRYGPR